MTDCVADGVTGGAVDGVTDGPADGLPVEATGSVPGAMADAAFAAFDAFDASFREVVADALPPPKVG
ncbi:hypothetical protein QT196_06940 [Streptomyces sp. P9-2B-2]|uniref:hypothetical protein n=1 Tax=Streptomyces sp. P9-2B-2 TaxID=3057114 RepID=UPI0025B60E55|nr:hypothetical protein [Streptomyces sp. P9-2B-2]WJY37038.1 hypothetical protein QT196_06940 [Streptomyces sp. P9-2B-2]